MHSKSYPECRPRRSPLLGRPVVSAACALPRRRRAAGTHTPGFRPAHAVAAGERRADRDEQARTNTREAANTPCGKGPDRGVRPLKSSAETRSRRQDGRIFTRSPAPFSYGAPCLAGYTRNQIVTAWKPRKKRGPAGSIKITNGRSEDRKKERRHNHADGRAGRGIGVSHDQTRSPLSADAAGGRVDGWASESAIRACAAPYGPISAPDGSLSRPWEDMTPWAAGASLKDWRRGRSRGHWAPLGTVNPSIACPGGTARIFVTAGRAHSAIEAIASHRKTGPMVRSIDPVRRPYLTLTTTVLATLSCSA